MNINGISCKYSNLTQDVTIKKNRSSIAEYMIFMMKHFEIDLEI